MSHTPKEKYEQDKSTRRESYASLPFGDFIKLLQQKGFIIDVKDFAEFTRVFESFSGEAGFASSSFPGKNEDPELRIKYYLAPLICRNETEQAEFYRLFDNFFTTVKTVEGDKTTVDETPKKWWQKNKLILAVAGSIMLIGLAYAIWKTTSKPHSPDIYHAEIRVKTYAGGFWLGHPVEFSFVDSPVNNSGKGVTVAWSLGDGTDTVRSKEVTHVYKTCSNHNVFLLVRDSVSGRILDSTSQLVYISDSLQIINLNGTEFVPNDTVNITAINADTSYNAKNTGWLVINLSANKVDTVTNTFPDLRYIAKDTGTYAVQLLRDDNECSAHASAGFNVENKSGFSLLLESVGEPVGKEFHLSPYWLWGGILLSVLGLVGWYFLKRRVRQNKRLPGTAGNDFPGMDPPLEIPFLSKNEKIVKLQKQSASSSLLLQRTQSEATYLDVPKTLRTSINNFGLLTPEYAHRQKDKDYLLLIDTSIGTGSQYFHLFSYLVKTFARDNVNLSYYFFHQTPEKVYTENSRSNQNLSRLKDRHYGSNLIIFSKAHAFVSDALPQVDGKIKEELGFWNKRIIVTPLPAKDWSGEERILSAFFNLIPADIEALLTLVKFINEDIPGSSSFKKEDWKTYESRYVNVEEITALKNYINDEEIFQWICALAVFKKIRWEVIIEMGKTILSRYNSTGKLNYSNLLKIARIKWIEEGSFPSSLRLALLKELAIENELLARQTMLALLTESDQLVEPGSFSYEEKMIQQYANSFVLYANDNLENAHRKSDAEEFMKLWKKNNIIDMPLRIYLANKERKWDTPLNALGRSKTNISADEFINTIFKKRIPVAAYIALALSVLAILFLIASRLLIKDLYSSPLNSSLNIVNAEHPADFKVTVQIEDNDCLIDFLDDTLSFKIAIVSDLNNDEFAVSQNSTTLRLDTMYGGNSNEEPRVLIFSKHLNSQALTGKNSFISLYTGDDSIRTPFPGDSLYREYRLALAGTGCKEKNQSINIRLSYDSTDIEGLAGTFGKTIAPDSFAIATSVQDKQKVPSTVFYYDKKLKDRASRLAELATQFFKRPVTITDISRNSTTTGPQIDLWIGKIGCTEILPAAMTNLVQTTWYFNSNMRYGLLFDRNSLTIMNAGTSKAYQSYTIQKIQQCGNQYTIELVTAAAGKPVVISLIQSSRLNMRIVNADVTTAGTYQLLFDKNNYSTTTQAYAGDIGSWNYGSGYGESFVSIERDRFTIHEDNAQLQSQAQSAQTSVTMTIGNVYRDNMNNRIYRIYTPGYPDEEEILIITDKGGIKYLNSWNMNGRKKFNLQGFNMKEINFSNTEFSKIVKVKAPVSSKKKEILWVDDHPENNKYIMDELKTDSVNTTTVSTNREALALLQTRQFDLILTDVGRDRAESGVTELQRQYGGVLLLEILPSGYIRQNKVIVYTPDSTAKRYGPQIQKIGVNDIYSNYDELVNVILKKLGIQRSSPKKSRD